MNKNLTTVTMTDEQAAAFKEAASHYGYENLAQFFRASGHSLIEQYKRGDVLTSPLQFKSVPPAKK